MQLALLPALCGVSRHIYLVTPTGRQGLRRCRVVQAKKTDTDLLVQYFGLLAPSESLSVA